MCRNACSNNINTCNMNNCNSANTCNVPVASNINSNTCNSCSGMGSTASFSNFTSSNSNLNGFDDMNYARSYVRNQTLCSVFNPTNGLSNGTMFPELVMPYCPGQALEEMNFLRSNNGGGCCR